MNNKLFFTSFCINIILISSSLNATVPQNKLSKLDEYFNGLPEGDIQKARYNSLKKEQKERFADLSMIKNLWDRP